MPSTINASTSSGIVQTADTSGVLELQSNGTTQLTVASGGVTVAGLTTTGTTTISNLSATGTFGGGVITRGTTVASTSGTSIDFTGIPSWVRRVTVMFNNVSTNGTSNIIVQLGSGSVTTSGYVGISVYATITGGTGGSTATSGIPIFNNSATYNQYGNMVFSTLGSNVWVFSGVFGNTVTTALTSNSSGGVSLSGALDRVRITTVNGTDTFDAGTINILYEG